MKFPVWENGLMIGITEDGLSTKDGTILRSGIRRNFEHVNHKCRGKFESYGVKLFYDEVVEWIARYFKFNLRKEQIGPVSSVKVLPNLRSVPVAFPIPKNLIPSR
jgi:hypothetical protein